MMNSRFDTLSVPQQITDSGDINDTGTLITEASKTPLRIVVRNISFGAEVLLTFDAATTQQIPFSSNTYMLPAGLADTFMIAPGQRMYAISTSALCRISVAISEALPIDSKP